MSEFEKNDIAIYLRRTTLGLEFWEDVTDYLGHQSLIELKATLDNERAELSVILADPIDKDGEFIIPDTGDDIVICSDKSRTKILSTGWIYYVKDTDYTRDEETIVEYEIKAKVRDFSKEYVEIDEQKVTPILTLAEMLLDSKNIKEFLGGTLPSGTIVPKIIMETENVDIPSFKFSGLSMEGLAKLLQSFGLHFKIVHFIEPDEINNLKIIQCIYIFDESGQSTITPDWAQGLNDQILRDGEIPSPFYVNNEITPFEPETIWCETGFEYEKDASPVKNIIRLSGYIYDQTSKITFKKFTQRDDNNTTFDLERPVLDIVYVARYIADLAGNNLMSIESVASNSVFNIDLPSAEKIENFDKPRLQNNGLGGRLVFRINSDGIEYVLRGDIVGQTITLDDPDPEDPNDTQVEIPNLTTDDTIEFVNGYDLLKTGRSSYPGDGNGYVIKSTKFGENATITFTDYDKPKEKDVVIVGYYDLKSFRLPQVYEESRDLYDAGLVNEEIPYPITQQQFEVLSEAYKKYMLPRTILSFKSYRLNFCEIGWNIPVDLQNRRKVIGNFIINEATSRLISSVSPYHNKALWESEYKAYSYRDTLADLLAKLQIYSELREIELEQKDLSKRIHQIMITHFHFEGTLIPDLVTPILAPTNLTVEFINIDEFKLFWIGSTDQSYRVTVFLDGNYNQIANGYNYRPQNSGELINGVDITEHEKFWIRVWGFKDGIESDTFSEIVVEKSAPVTYVEKIVFNEFLYGGTFKICIANTDLSEKKYLTDGIYTEDMPNFNRQGTKIVYVKRWSSTNSDIFIMNVDGSEKVNLTNFASGIATESPAFNKAGTKIIFGYRNNNTSVTKVARMNVDGTGLEFLYDTSIYGNVYPRYDWEENYIYFNNGSYGVVRANQATNQVENFKAGNTYFYEFNSKNQIVYTDRLYNSDPYDIYVQNTVNPNLPFPDGSFEAVHNNDSSDLLGYAVWNSDNSEIYYNEFSNSYTRHQINKLIIETGEIIKLTNDFSIHHAYPQIGMIPVSDSGENPEEEYQERVIYNSNKSGVWQSYSVDPYNLSDEINLTNNNSIEDHYITYNETTQMYLFSRRIDSVLRIHIMNLQGQILYQSNSNDNELRATFNKSGDKIAYFKNNIIIIADTAGNIISELSSKFASVIPIRWTNDDRIIYNVYGSPYEIRCCNINGSNDILLSNEYAAFSPAVSANFDKIVFRASGDQLVEMDIDGSNLQYITNDGFEKEYPCYSPDGSKIAFLRSGYQGHVHILEKSNPSVHINITPYGSGSYEINDGWKNFKF